MSGLLQSVKDTVLDAERWLDQKTRINNDLYIIQYVIRRGLDHILKVSLGKVSYWYLFEEVVKQNPHQLALVFVRPNPGRKGDDAFRLERYTFQELYDIILRMSYILVDKYSVQPNDTIGINCTNKPLFLILWFALWNIGANPAFLNYNTIGKPLVHCIKISAISKVFIDPECAQNVRDTQDDIRAELPNVELVYLNETELMNDLLNFNSVQFRQRDDLRKAHDHDWDIGALIYTSGTTGLPKSAIMSWRKCCLGVSLYGHIVRLKANNTVFTSMPLYHSTASMLGVCAAWTQGATVALSKKFSASTIWTQVKLCEATHLQYVGEVCRYLLNSPVHPDERAHKLKVAYGNGLRSDVWKEFKERFNIPVIGEFYSATESPIALTSYQEGDFGIGACRNYGKLINFILQFQQTLIKMDPEDINTEYRNSKGFCEVAEVNEPGELIMKLFWSKKPETVFQGYLGNKKETESKIIRNVFKKGDAWFRSGDLLKMDEEGLFYFVDRLGDTYRWKSENVSATEVENQFREIREISQVVVVGVKVPNHEGRAGFAVLELVPEVTDNQTDVILKKIVQHLKSELPKYAMPIFIKFVDKISNSDNFKVPKKQFRSQVLPKGVNNDELIYWLNNDVYEELTQEVWDKIISGGIKI